MKGYKRDMTWYHNYDDVVAYVEEYKRRPSRHYAEDHHLFNWIKYNKKMMRRGRMSQDHQEVFKELLALLEKYRRVNKYTYATPRCSLD